MWPAAPQGDRGQGITGTGLAQMWTELRVVSRRAGEGQRQVRCRTSRRRCKSMRSNRISRCCRPGGSIWGRRPDGRKYGYSAVLPSVRRVRRAQRFGRDLHHEPGRAMFVDWAGDTVTDRGRGDRGGGQGVPVRGGAAVFRDGVLPEGSPTMGMDTWIAGHVRGVHRVGGAPVNWWCRTTP